MKKTRKRIFGLIGLLVVGAMTAVAINLPSPDAAAIETDSVDVEVRVNVGEAGFYATLGEPRDGEIVTSPQLEVVTNYSASSQIDYYLYYTDSSGQEHKVPIGRFNPTDSAGVHTFMLNLDNYAGFSNYQLESVATGSSGATREDRVGFVYQAINAVFTGTSESAGPIFEVNVNGSVEKVQVQVYDKNGKPIFVDADGTEHPIIVDRAQFDKDQLLLTLPFTKYGITDGEYAAVFVAYNANDDIIGVDTVDFTYKINSDGSNSGSADTPDVPDTGMSGNALNISRSDFIISGIILFGLVSSFAVYLIVRKKHC